MLINPFTWGLLVTFMDIFKYYQKSKSNLFINNVSFAKALEKINEYVDKSKFNKNFNYLA